MASEFPGERYFNKYAFLAYCLVIAAITAFVDPKLSLVGLIISGVFVGIWTFVVGGAMYLVILWAMYVVAPKSAALRKATEYLPWVVPSIGFMVFLATVVAGKA